MPACQIVGVTLPPAENVALMRRWKNSCNIPCDGGFTKCVELHKPLTQAISDTLPECRSVGRALSAVVQASYSREHFV